MNDLVSNLLVNLPREVTVVEAECEGVCRNAVQELRSSDALQVIALDAEAPYDGISEGRR